MASTELARRGIHVWVPPQDKCELCHRQAQLTFVVWLHREHLIAGPMCNWHAFRLRDHAPILLFPLGRAPDLWFIANAIAERQRAEQAQRFAAQRQYYSGSFFSNTTTSSTGGWSFRFG